MIVECEPSRFSIPLRRWLPSRSPFRSGCPVLRLLILPFTGFSAGRSPLRPSAFTVLRPAPAAGSSYPSLYRFFRMPRIRCGLLY